MEQGLQSLQEWLATNEDVSALFATLIEESPSTNDEVPHPFPFTASKEIPHLSQRRTRQILGVVIEGKKTYIRKPLLSPAKAKTQKALYVEAHTLKPTYPLPCGCDICMPDF